MEKSKHLPCPFCGDEGSIMVREHEHFSQTYQVSCTKCDSNGPWRRTEDDAWSVWDSRYAFEDVFNELNAKMDGAMAVVDRWVKIDNLIRNDRTAPAGVDVSEIVLARLKHYQTMVVEFSMIKSIQKADAWDRVAAFMRENAPPVNGDLPKAVLFHLQVLKSMREAMESFSQALGTPTQKQP